MAVINRWIEDNGKTAVLEIVAKGGDNAQIIIDSEDFTKVRYCNWRINENGVASSKNYNKNILMHRIIYGGEGVKRISHINGNKFDNRKINLKYY